MSKKKIIGGIAGAIVFVVISLLPETEQLSRNGLITLAGLVSAVFWLITGFMPDYLAMLSMCVLWVLFKAMPINTAFAAFSGSSFWLLFGALIIGVAASETGLLRRLALGMLQIFPASFAGQCSALIISGTVISPLIPSQTAKSAIVAPLARSISESMGFQYRSRGAKGIFLSFYTGYTSAGMGFLSASFVSYSLVGLLEKNLDGAFATSWMQFFLYILPWTILCTSVMGIWTILTYRPKEKVEFSKDKIKEELKLMGPMSWQEKLVMALLTICLIVWMLERVIGIAAWLTACIGAVVLMVVNIVDRTRLRTKVAWDAMVFLGCFLGIGGAFSTNGVNDWVNYLLMGYMQKIMGNMVVFVIVVALLTYITRFVLVSWTSAVVILGSLLMPLCASAGIHPFLALITIYVSTNTWNVIYQSTPMVTSMVATENKMVLHQDLIPASCAYMAVNIMALLACIPFWKMAGLC